MHLFILPVSSTEGCIMYVCMCVQLPVGTEGVHGGGGTEGVPVSSSATMLSYTTNVSYEQTLLYLATDGDV